MKITSDNLQALQQQDPTWNRSKSATEGFDALLHQELEKSASSAGRTLSAPPPGAKTLGTASLQQTASSTEQGVMSDIEGILNKWEDYAQSLGTSGAQESLRQAYDVLESISQDVADVKDSLAKMQASGGMGQDEGAYPGLSSLVNEIEVLTLTEQYKFNRGDYV